MSMRKEIEMMIERIKEDARKMNPYARALIDIITSNNIDINQFSDIREFAYYLLSHINDAYKYEIARYLYTIIYGYPPLAIFTI